MNNRPIALMEVKQALKDSRFRETLPPELNDLVQKYLQNPSCACNLPLYKKIMTDAKQQLKSYYPNRSIADIDEEVRKLAENNFSVINCHIDELEEKLKKLPSGRKQIACARYENFVTVVINELDIIY